MPVIPYPRHISEAGGDQGASRKMPMPPKASSAVPVVSKARRVSLFGNNFVPQVVSKTKRNSTSSLVAGASVARMQLPPFVSVKQNKAAKDDDGKATHTCTDQCRAFASLCAEGSKCVTIKTATGCKMKCREADGSETGLGSHITTAPPKTLRPLSERRCEISGKECEHGTCQNGLNCTCDRGYIGDTCSDLECAFPCSHGVCYLASPTVSKCHCDPGWEGIQCHRPYCSRQCQNGGACMWDVKPHPAMICSCEDPWIGDFCERVKPKASNTLALVVGIATPIVCFLALIISWYILWRKRVIFVFKIINMFKAYEDDDEKVYDAYVSLTESDADYVFVKHVLQPKLEDMGHRLYLHARDGEAGVKSEEILKAVEKSRRCIMLLNSDYISNEWCRRKKRKEKKRFEIEKVSRKREESLRENERLQRWGERERKKIKKEGTMVPF
ncbi:teneurin-1 [Elysia marginata]|uniref:Teneurin-1 n=1 Tax=Elysia marginata TaxID=1093978 RepID=A0AAV4H1P5_9GAST|nr:teneurin-1 [Elysia marginata]